MSIAAALATKSATSLFELVKRKFTGDKEATEALAAVSGAAPGSPEVTAVAEHLASATAEDREFDAELRGAYFVTVGRDQMSNRVGGDVSGKMVQARDIEGDISL